MKFSFIKNIIFVSLIIFFGSNFNGKFIANVSSNIIDSNSNFLENLPVDDYILGPGDILNISVIRDVDELNTINVIDSSGTIYLPTINRVYVSGLTITELNNALNLKYRDYVLRPNVQVQILSYRPVRVYLDGEIQDPGLYTLQGSFFPGFDENNRVKIDEINSNQLNFLLKNELSNSSTFKSNLFKTSSYIGTFPTVFEAIRAAGGITQYSDLSNISLVRINTRSNGGGKIKTKLNFLDLINYGDNSQNIRIYDGDVITINKSDKESIVQLNKAIKTNLNPKFINVFVSGMVESPGVQIISRASTLNDAIAIAGGKKTLSGKVNLIRINADGSIDKRKISYNEKNKPGSFKNPYLREKDILFVQKSSFNKASTVINEITAPIVGIYRSYELFDMILD